MNSLARLGALRTVVERLELPAAQLDRVRAALNELDASLQQEQLDSTEARLVEVSEALFRLASLDFSTRAQLRGDGSVLDAVGGCINMLSEELEAQFEERARIEQELEDRVRARTAELEASMERYKALIEGTDAVPWEADASTLAISYISPRAARLLGAPDQAFLGNQSLWEHLQRDDRKVVREKLSRLANGGAIRADLEYRFLREDGATVEIRSTVAHRPALDGSPGALQGIMFDVTAQRELERQLQQAQKLEAVGRLASGIAHEINTPVQFVSDSVHFARTAVTDLNVLIEVYRELTQTALSGQECREIAERVLVAEEEADLAYVVENLPQALDRATSGLSAIAVIVRSMKDFAHPDRGELSSVDLNRALESTLVVARNEYKHVAELELELAEIPPVVCRGGEINQVLLNIIVNAAHAIDSFTKGSGKGRIRVSTRRDGGDVVIAIGDTGGGIAEADRARIYDPFFTTKDVGKGTGQGLFIARAIVEEQHGGKLSFETRLGDGTTFFIRLPIDGASPKNGSSSAPSPPGRPEASLRGSN